jgi:CRISPR-associated endonuclease/helicase Cas3
MADLTASDFPAYFEAVHGHRPFPWQTRLLEQVTKEGRWPSLLDLPTGTGKTATVDVAVFHLALDADVPARERKAPRRIVMVVDRRTVVDQAFERAKKIADAVTKASRGPLSQVRERLCALRARAKITERHCVS